MEGGEEKMVLFQSISAQDFVGTLECDPNNEPVETSLSRLEYHIFDLKRDKLHMDCFPPLTCCLITSSRYQKMEVVGQTVFLLGGREPSKLTERTIDIVQKDPKLRPHFYTGAARLNFPENFKSALAASEESGNGITVTENVCDGVRVTRGIRNVKTASEETANGKATSEETLNGKTSAKETSPNDKTSSKETSPNDKMPSQGTSNGKIPSQETSNGKTLSEITEDGKTIYSEMQWFPMPVGKRWYPVCSSLNGVLYNFGQKLSDAEVFNSSSAEWQPLPVPKQLKTRWVSAPALSDPHNKQILIHLPARETQRTSFLYAFCPESRDQKWKCLSIDFPIWSECAAVVEGVIYLYTNAGELFEAYDTCTGSWLNVKWSSPPLVNSTDMRENLIRFQDLVMLADGLLCFVGFSSGIDPADELDMTFCVFLKFKVERNGDTVILSPDPCLFYEVPCTALPLTVVPF